MNRYESMKKISIIIPVLNEEEGLPYTIREIPLEKLEKRYEVETIIVDGMSSDNSVDIAKNEGAKVIFEKQRGYGRAYRTGFEKASGYYLVTLDGDGTYPAKVIPEMIKIAEDGADFVTTNRFEKMEKETMSLKNRIGNEILSLVCRILHGLPFEDSQSGMWMIKKDKWNQIKKSIKGKGMEFSQEIKIECHRNNLKCREIPITYVQRRGEAKLNPWKDGILNLLHLLTKK